MRRAVVALLLLLGSPTAAQPTQDAAPAPAASAAPAAPPAAVTIEELQAQLKAALELLQRHDVELKALKAAALKPPPAPEAPAQPQHWYERISIRGYTQLRYTLPGGVYNDKLINSQGDKSLGGNGGFLIRRARVIIFGEVHPRLSIYLQPDFASAIDGQLGVAILRDWYADVFLDRKQEHRLRIGQSKVPYGWENMQSSQNRAPFDRSDALNSAVFNERDLGVFYYWAPGHVRRRFKDLVDSGLKGSGDYGVVALGLYNGQTANSIELNKVPHAVARVTWPFVLRSQILELAAGGYFGRYTVKLEDGKDGTKYTSTQPDNTFNDGRGHVSVILYPKPCGFAFEYNAGIGPALGVNNPTVVGNRFLHGGYLLVNCRFANVARTVAMVPYVRGQLYEGGKKFYANAPRYSIKEIEFGLEWQILKALEMTASYLISDRTSDKQPYDQQYGHWVRLQAQFNY